MNSEKRLLNLLARIKDDIKEHTSWRRKCLNLQAAESLASPLVHQVLGSDLSRRYFLPGIYGGGKFIGELLEIVEDSARRLFKVKYVELRPVTGNLAVLGWIIGLTKKGDTVLTTSGKDGGYPVRLADRLGIKMKYLPFDFNEMEVKLDEAKKEILRLKPRLIILGASEFLFPYPVKEISTIAKKVGSIVVYDSSHVLGLIAGGEFQDPSGEGADIMGGNTQKTFCGPQGGIILVKDNKDIYIKIKCLFDSPPCLASCVHLNRIVALGVSILEMEAIGKEFAKQIVLNAQALAYYLQKEGFEVFCSHKGFTKSHQVLLKNNGFCSKEGREIQKTLEDSNIIVDSVVRIGTQEVTRLGMKEPEMEKIANLFRQAVLEKKPSEKVRKSVEKLMSNFRTLKFIL